MPRTGTDSFYIVMDRSWFNGPSYRSWWHRLLCWLRLSKPVLDVVVAEDKTELVILSKAVPECAWEFELNSGFCGFRRVVVGYKYRVRAVPNIKETGNN